MNRMLIAGIAVSLTAALGVGNATAAEITTKKMAIKDNANPAKTKLQLQSSKDPGVEYTDAVDPDVDGASVYVYSAVNDLCLVIPGGELWADNGKVWKYKDKLTKTQLKIQDGKLQVKFSPGSSFPLSTDPQGTVQATVQVGGGERFCMSCDTPTKDTEKVYSAKKCEAVVCSGDEVACFPGATTTTTSTTTTSSTTTTTLAGTVVGAIATTGRFNLMSQLGLPGAEAACDASFSGSHVCKYAELQATQAGALSGLRDTGGALVTSFWAVDPAAPEAGQCGQTAFAGAPRWTYNTAHIGVGGDFVELTNATGELGSFSAGGGNVRNCPNSKWIGCCSN